MVRGIVCSKDVAHREMCTRLANPRILLLHGAIVYQRVEGRLLSLEPVMMQVSVSVAAEKFPEFFFFVYFLRK